MTHPAIKATIQRTLYGTKEALGSRFQDLFEGSDKTVVVSLACCAVSPHFLIHFLNLKSFNLQLRCALEEYETGKYKMVQFQARKFQEPYNDIIQNIVDRILPDPARATVFCQFYEDVSRMYVSITRVVVS